MTKKSNKNINNWQTKKLGEVCDFYRGLTYKKTDEVTESDNVVLRANNIDLELNSLNFSKLKYISEDIEIPEIKKIKKGSVLICTASGSKKHLGKVAFIDKDYNYAFGGFMGQLVPNNKIINSKYFYNILISGNFRELLDSLMSGVNINNLRFDLIKDFEISFPKSLDEQKRIVKILDQAFVKVKTAKKITEKNLNNSKELFEVYLENIFKNHSDDWEGRRLQELTSILGDGLHGTPKYKNDGEYYFINGNNLDDGKIVFKERTKKVSVSEHKKYRKDLNERTVLVSINGTLGNVAFYNNEKVILGKSACYFNLLGGIDKNFIKYVIKSSYFINYVCNVATGATIKNVSLKSMRDFKIIFPKSISVQKQIVKKLDELSAQTNKLEINYKIKIQELTNLKKSILQKAFEGRL